jgi:uncharacterized membrane protein
MDYAVWKWLHVLSSTVLFGTGIGTAFFMFVANRTGEVRAIAVVTRFVVIADTLFTLPTVIFQPLSGYMLMQIAGIPLLTPWIWMSLALYAVAGLCWLPVVWLQLQMRNMAIETAVTGAPMLPARYWRYERVWVLLGIPAFTALVVVFYLMVVKPV